jgi:hypothetical protein
MPNVELLLFLLGAVQPLVSRTLCSRLRKSYSARVFPADRGKPSPAGTEATYEYHGNCRPAGFR